jgi:hypothetical protein
MQIFTEEERADLLAIAEGTYTPPDWALILKASHKWEKIPSPSANMTRMRNVLMDFARDAMGDKPFTALGNHFSNAGKLEPALRRLSGHLDKLRMDHARRVVDAINKEML